GMYVYTDVNGDYYIAETEDSVQRFSLGRIVVYDANKRQSLGSMTVETIKDGQLYLITVSADESFLLDSKTVYPVTIDPSITVNESSDGSGIVDATVCDGAKGTAYGEEALNYVGYINAERGTAMTFIRLDGLANNSIYKTLNSAEITNVDVNVYGIDSTTAVNLYRVTKNISTIEKLITWDTISSNYSTSTNRYANVGGNSFNQLDITPFVKGWKNGNYVNSMSFVVAPLGYNTNYCVRFNSSDHTSTMYRPYVTLDYTFKNLINNGTYYIENKQLGTYVQPKNGATASGTAMELWSFSGTEKQEWTITALREGYYKITSNISGLALSVASSDVSKENGAVVQEAYTNATRQQWRIYRTTYGGLAIKPRSAGTGVNVLSVSDGNNGNGAVVSQRGYAYNDSFKDEWYLCPKFENGEDYSIINKELGNYLRPQGGIVSSIVRDIELWEQLSEENHGWTLTLVGDGYYSIIDNITEYALSVSPTQTTSENGTVIQSRYTGTTNQQWKIYISIDNGMVLKPRSAGNRSLRLSVQDGVTGNGAVVTQRAEVYNLSYKEEWLIEKYVPFADGVYYLKNRQLGSYLRPAGGYLHAGNTIELWESKGYNYEKWNFVSLPDGYYKILSVPSGLALTVEGTELSNENASIIQSAYEGYYNQQWKVYKTSKGGFALKPRHSESNASSNFVLSVSEGNLGNGAVVSQRNFVDNYSFKEEWVILTEPVYVLFVDNYFDDGFMVRYDRTEEESALFIEECMDIANNAFISNLSLKLLYRSAKHHDSCTDKCKGTTTEENIGTPCSCKNILGKGLNHNTVDKLFEDMEVSYTGHQSITNILWSGHYITDTDGTENRSVSCETTVLILQLFGESVETVQRVYLSSLLFHEIMHQIDALDHYHDLDEKSGNCLNESICSVCNSGEYGCRDADCIMCELNTTLSRDNLICNQCKQEVINHLSQHH
ncbi:MAG: RICIN domain-containing protein, partial [Clostridia bacterium]|nr:RICIN domain-containing protein [Clostridia bacterium]